MPEPRDDEQAGLTLSTWRKVVGAIEDAIPLYDQVNNTISLGKAQVARKFAVQSLHLTDGVKVLDSGVGPGTTSKLILTSAKPSLLVGLDGSTRQLQAAKNNLGAVQATSVEFIRGSFEFLPFRENIFDVIITCYALRDSLDLSKAVEEYHRICNETGVFADVDLGKPNNLFKRVGSTLYVRYLMPLIAKASIIGRMRGNPWRMIVPTYRTLPTNTVLLSRIRSRFNHVEFKDFLLGGIIVIVARKA